MVRFDLRYARAMRRRAARQATHEEGSGVGERGCCAGTLALAVAAVAADVDAASATAASGDGPMRGFFATRTGCALAASPPALSRRASARRVCERVSRRLALCSG